LISNVLSFKGIYALSKAAVHSMSDTLRLELKPFNIQVTVIAPGNKKNHLSIIHLFSHTHKIGGITSNFGKAGESQVSVPEGKSKSLNASPIL
jgi:NAD(P)-dependent dehydrogenase (short-subunit alcohol dehydrogenase family)